MTINLTDAQKAIVNMDEGPILVKAGPGSGKTRVLIERVKRLLRTQPMTKILALTFSTLCVARDSKILCLLEIQTNRFMDLMVLIVL